MGKDRLTYALHPRQSCLIEVPGGMMANPGRGLAVNFLKKCGYSHEKKIISTAYFLHLFAVNAVNRGELFIFTAFSVFLQKRIVPTRVRSSDQLSLISLKFLVNLNQIV